MKLCSATLISIRGLPDMTCHFADPATGAPHRVCAITGPGGSGKTRLIEAIIAAKEVLAPYGPIMTGESWIREGESAAKIELTFALDEEECRRAGLSEPLARAEALFRPRACGREADEGLLSVLEHYAHDDTGKIEYLPGSRTLPPPGPAHGLTPIEQRLWRASRDGRKYAFVSRLLVELAASPSKGQKFARDVSALCPWLRYTGGKSDDPLCAFSSRDRPAVRASELSSVEGDAVLIAAVTNLVNVDRAILFVDRPELSADERRIGEWAAALQTLGRDVQLIFATSSPALLSAIDPRCIIELGRGTA